MIHHFILDTVKKCVFQYFKLYNNNNIVMLNVLTLKKSRCNSKSKIMSKKLNFNKTHTWAKVKVKSKRKMGQKDRNERKEKEKEKQHSKSSCVSPVQHLDTHCRMLTGKDLQYVLSEFAPPRTLGKHTETLLVEGSLSTLSPVALHPTHLSNSIQLQARSWV